MSLIKCTECGKEFSDKAPACPNCGCPTDIVLQELAGSEKESLKTEDKKDKNLCGTYDICGAYKFSITVKQQRYVLFESIIRYVLKNTITQSKELYDAYENIDTLIEKSPEDFSTIMESTIAHTIETLDAAGIYKYDMDSFYQKYEQSIDTKSIMEPIVSKYLEIMGLYEKEKEYHDYVRDMRYNTWSGGGFGVSGAIKGHVKAQMLNLGTAVIHSIPDNMARDRDMNEILQLKSQLYHDSSTRQTFIKSVFLMVSGVYKALEKELCEIGILEVVKRDSSESGIIFKKSESYPENKKQLLIEAFKVDPLSRDVIQAIMGNGYDENGDVKRYAKDIGYYDEIQDTLQGALITEKYKEQVDEIIDRDWASYEEFCEVLEKIKALDHNGVDIRDLLKLVINNYVEYPHTWEQFCNSKKLIEEVEWEFEDTKENPPVFPEPEDEKLYYTEDEMIRIPKIVKKSCENYVSRLKNIEGRFYAGFEYDFDNKIMEHEGIEEYKNVFNFSESEEIYCLAKEADIFFAVTSLGLKLIDKEETRLLIGWKWLKLVHLEKNVFDQTLMINDLKFSTESFFHEMPNLLVDIWARVDEYVDAEDYTEPEDVDYTQLTVSPEEQAVVKTVDESMCSKFVQDYFSYLPEKCRDQIKADYADYSKEYNLPDSCEIFYSNRQRYQFSEVYSILYTDSGLYMCDEGMDPEKYHFTWPELCLLPINYIDVEDGKDIWIKEASFTLRDDDRAILLDLRFKLREFIVKNFAEAQIFVRRQRLSCKAADYIHQICQSISQVVKMYGDPDQHHFSLEVSREAFEDSMTSRAIVESIALGIPEEDEIFYYGFCDDSGSPEEGVHVYITNSGIYLNQKNTFISWTDFKNLNFSLCKNEKKEKCIMLGDELFPVYKEGKFLNHLLKNIQELINASDFPTLYVKTMEDMEVITKSEDADFIASQLSQIEGITVFPCDQYDLPKVIHNECFELESLFNRMNEMNNSSCGSPVCLLRFDKDGSYLLVTDVILCARVCSKDYGMELRSIICMECGRNEQNIPSLIIKCDTPEGYVIDTIPLGEAVLAIDLEAFNEKLEEKYPYDRANDFREAIGVERNIDKAEILYRSAIEKKIHVADSEYFLAKIYLEKQQFKLAADYFSATYVHGRKESTYDLAFLIYQHRDCVTQPSCHGSALRVMDDFAQKNYKDAKKIILLMLDDPTWMELCERELQQDKAVYLDIVKRRGMTTQEYNKTVAKTAFSKVKNLFNKQEEPVEKPKKLFCTYCGKQISPDSTFCVYCGKKVKGK